MTHLTISTVQQKKIGFDKFSISIEKILLFCNCLGQDVDEDELEAELEALEQEQLDNDLLGVGTSTSELPEVPTGEVKEPAAASKEKEKKKGKIHNNTYNPNSV